MYFQSMTFGISHLVCGKISCLIGKPILKTEVQFEYMCLQAIFSSSAIFLKLSKISWPTDSSCSSHMLSSSFFLRYGRCPSHLAQSVHSLFSVVSERNGTFEPLSDKWVCLYISLLNLMGDITH
jgi:hypothetical protein